MTSGPDGSLEAFIAAIADAIEVGKPITGLGQTVSNAVFVLEMAKDELRALADSRNQQRPVNPA